MCEIHTQLLAYITFKKFSSTYTILELCINSNYFLTCAFTKNCSHEVCVTALSYLLNLNIFISDSGRLRHIEIPDAS